MKQKLNLYTVLIVGYSLVICAIYHAKFSSNNSTSPYFATTPINQVNQSIFQGVKPTLSDGKISVKTFKSDIS